MTTCRVRRAWDGRYCSRHWEVDGLARSGFLTLDWHIITGIDWRIRDGAPRRELRHRELTGWKYRALSGWRVFDNNHGERLEKEVDYASIVVGGLWPRRQSERPIRPGRLHLKEEHSDEMYGYHSRKRGTRKTHLEYTGVYHQIPFQARGNLHVSKLCRGLRNIFGLSEWSHVTCHT